MVMVMKKNLLLLSILAVATFLFLGPIIKTNALSADLKNEVCNGANLQDSSTGAGSGCTEQSGGITKILKTVINLFSLIVGVVAVIMIIVNGLKFITSGGDAQRVSSARSGIIYALVGLVVVALAQTIVKFVLNKVK